MAVVRRSGLWALDVESLDCAQADLRGTGMLGGFAPDPMALEPAAEATAPGCGRMHGSVDRVEEPVLPQVRQRRICLPAATLGRCLTGQLCCLEIQPARGFPDAISQLTRLTRLSLRVWALGLAGWLGALVLAPGLLLGLSGQAH